MAPPEEPRAGIAPGGPQPRAAVLRIDGPVGPRDADALCRRARALLESAAADVVVCDIDANAKPDLALVNALARIVLSAHRLGRSAEIRDATPELRDLLDFLGLTDVLPACQTSGVEMQRQAEEREQTRRVEEEADPGDLSV